MQRSAQLKLADDEDQHAPSCPSVWHACPCLWQGSELDSAQSAREELVARMFAAPAWGASTRQAELIGAARTLEGQAGEVGGGSSGDGVGAATAGWSRRIASRKPHLAAAAAPNPPLLLLMLPHPCHLPPACLAGAPRRGHVWAGHAAAQGRQPEAARRHPVAAGHPDAECVALRCRTACGKEAGTQAASLPV